VTYDHDHSPQTHITHFNRPLPPPRIAQGSYRVPVEGYSGYGDGVGTDLTEFITDQMRTDWEANREELMAFWRSGKTETDVFPDALPWLYGGGSTDPLPWAERHLGRAPRLRER
jgi:hypothetical protein